ncbi:MAG: DUF2163 domain-containing protein [Alphaproteobacteria bacterium]|nr:DUF2163 domain-containing protein [Alphaproteobacteria bacterium]
MKTLTPALAAHLAGEVTTLCTCWKVSRTDGVILGFTEHDQDVVIDGIIYKAATGTTPTAIAASADLAVDNVDVTVVLDDVVITEADLWSGVYDNASVQMLLVNWASPADGSLVLSNGHIGQIRMGGPSATAEVRGLVQAFATNIGDFFSAGCRATLGDVHCRIDLSGLTVAGTVGRITSQRIFSLSGTGPVLEPTLPNRTVVAGRSFTHKIAATAFFDPAGNLLMFTASLGDGTALPSWLAFNATTLTFSGTPPGGVPSLTFSVTASDGAASVSGAFSLTIDPAGTSFSIPPVVAETPGNVRVPAGTAFGFELSPTTFYDADGEGLAYSASLSSGASSPPWFAFGALPSWIAFSAATLGFTGTAPLDGPNDANGVQQINQYILRLQATNGAGAVASCDFLLIATVSGDQGPPAAGYYAGGVVTFTSGANFGIPMEVKDSNGATLTTFLSMPRPLAVGDTFSIYPGCDKTAATCQDTYNNIINFRGEPFVPGIDAAMEYPGAPNG